jgi:hypothetical protein
MAKVELQNKNANHRADTLYKIWLGRQGSNLRITGPKPVALPLGYAPVRELAARG